MITDHQKQLLKALRRSRTSFTPPSNTSSASSSSSPLSSWIHLRSILLVVASTSSSSSLSSSSLLPNPTNRGSLKSPWSRRRRKHALLPKQWRNLFTPDGKLSDGGIKFLKKARCAGVDPSIRAEVWPFLLGVYDVNSSEEERDRVRTQNRRAYEKLRRRCQQILKRNNDSKSRENDAANSRDNAEELGQVLDSPDVDHVTSTRKSPSNQTGTQGAQDSDNRNPTPKHTNLTSEGEDDNGIITSDDPHVDGTKSTDSESSDDPKTTTLLDEHDRNFHEEQQDSPSKSYKEEDFVTWQRIMRVDAVRANGEWIVYSPSQALVSEHKARELAESVGLKDYDHLELCRIHHAARLVAILEAYALYDPEIGYCQGMSDLLTPIIAMIEEDFEAFWCFVGFMKKARHNFRLNEEGIRRQLDKVSKIIKCKDNHLYRHLEQLQAADCFFVYRMVVVLFRRELNFEQTLNLWEVMWADQAAIRVGIEKSAWGRMRLRAPPTDDLLLYAIAAGVLQRRKMIIEKYDCMEEIMRECNSMAGNLDVWKLLDDAHDLVVTLHDKL
ncbi:Rab GTPase-activating protein 22 [Linum grandiflorum]